MLWRIVDDEQRRAATQWPAAAALVLLLAGGVPGPVLSESEPAGTPGTAPPALQSLSSCSACTPPDGMPTMVLDAAGAESILAGMFDRNRRTLARTDSLYRAGRFGTAGTETARKGARRHFQLRALTAFDYLVDAAADARIRVASEEALTPAFGNGYANTAVYPIHTLRRAIVGAGGFCLEYDLSRREEGIFMLGGVPTRLRPDRIPERGGVSSPALSLEFVDRIHKSVSLLYEARFCGSVRSETIVDRGDTLDLLIVDDLEGLYARKAGTHRMTAMIIWRSHTAGDQDPERARLGACAYFPRIAIHLPAFLPDIGLADLRDFDLPHPILSMEWVARRERCDWIKSTQGGGFEPWEAAGPRPAEVERRFPDL